MDLTRRQVQTASAADDGIAAPVHFAADLTEG